MNVLHLLALREADGLGSFLGGRVRLFPHQLYVAERASATDPVRWLLADEVGLGKTIEASLILNRLVHTGKVTRCLVVAPDTLTVQWLGELWRKYHQVFTLLDSDRLADVARDFGDDFNPFELHRRTVISLEMLIERPELTEQAVRAGIDLLVVDEAQRLRRPAGTSRRRRLARRRAHCGLGPARAAAQRDAARRRRARVLPVAAVAAPAGLSGGHEHRGAPRPGHTAPRLHERDASGRHWRLAASGRHSDRTHRDREGQVADCRRDGRAKHGHRPRRRRARQDRSRPPRAGVWRRARRGARSRRSGAAHAGAGDGRRRCPDRLAGVAGAALARREGEDAGLRRASRDARDASHDPRASGHNWRPACFTRRSRRHAATRKWRAFARPTVPACWCRPNAAAKAATSSSAGASCCSICRGSRRSWNNASDGSIASAARIPVEVVYFRPPAGIGRDVVRLFEALGLFREPLAGLEPQLAPVEGALEAIALDPDASLSDDRVAALVDAGARRPHAHSRSGVSAAAPRSVSPGDGRRHPGANSEGAGRAQPGSGGHGVDRSWDSPLRIRPAIASSRSSSASGALVDGLPGVPAGSGYVGTFDREEAVANESIDFFASGHPLVEGIFAHYEDSALGRAVRFEIKMGTRERAPGSWRSTRTGAPSRWWRSTWPATPRPDWAAAILRRPIVVRPVTGEAAEDPEWRSMVRRLGAQLDPTRRLHAVAAIEVRPAAS